MQGVFYSIQANRVRVSVVVLLLVAATLLPQLTWADRASDRLDDQFSKLSSMSPVVASSASANPGLTDPVLLAAYPEVLEYRRNVSAYLRYFAGQDCPDLATVSQVLVSRNSASANPGLTDPVLLAAYPEVLEYRRNVRAYLRYFAESACSVPAASQEAVDQRSISASAALTDPDLLAAYPEVLEYRRNIRAYLQLLGGLDCSALAAAPATTLSQRSVSTNPGLTDPALLAAYPEVLEYRRNVAAFLQYSAKQDCS